MFIRLLLIVVIFFQIILLDNAVSSSKLSLLTPDLIASCQLTNSRCVNSVKSCIAYSHCGTSTTTTTGQEPSCFDSSKLVVSFSKTILPCTDTFLNCLRIVRDEIFESVIV